MLYPHKGIHHYYLVPHGCWEKDKTPTVPALPTPCGFPRKRRLDGDCSCTLCCMAVRTKARWGKQAPVASSSHLWSPDNVKRCRNPQKLHCLHCTAHFSKLLCSIVVPSIWLSSSTCTLFCPYFTLHSCSWSSTSPFPPQVLQLHWLWGTHMRLGHTTFFFFFS